MQIQELKGKGPRTLWTRQVAALWDNLERDGRYIVKEEFVREKNDTIADFYIKLYHWYTKEAGKYMKVPEDAEFPIWLSMSEELMLQPTEGTVILKVEIPEDSYCLCNYDAWGYIVNYWYVPVDEADEAKHDAELKRLGLASDDELLLTDKGNFYPLQKRQLLGSWGRAFTQMPHDQVAGMVATAFELKKEWVKEVIRYEGE